jgi:hypothetical protein
MKNDHEDLTIFSGLVGQAVAAKNMRKKLLKYYQINKTMRFLIFIVSIVFLLSEISYAQELYKYPKGTSTRWASAENWKGEKGKGGLQNGGRKGSASFTLNAGEAKILSEAYGTSGVVHRIWMTINKRTPKVLRGLKIEMFWDNASTPAVSAPLGDFFGEGLGEMAAFENALFSSPQGKSFNCFIPMPFKKSMKIIVVNTTDEDVAMFYDIDYTLGDKLDRHSLYFHAIFSHQEKTKLREDYEILPKITGKGRFLGTNVSVIVNENDYLGTWWGEGEVKIYLDGDEAYPTLCGTGTEDYVGTGYGIGEYSHLYQGCTISKSKEMQPRHIAFYRYHIPDPIYFHSNIKVTIQQIGWVGSGEVMDNLSRLNNPLMSADEKSEPIDFSGNKKAILFERSDDYASCTYFYLSEPENNLNQVTRPIMDSLITK